MSDPKDVQPELALDPAEVAAHGDPDFESLPEPKVAVKPEPQDDPNDINGPVDTGEPEDQPVVAEVEEPKVESKDEEDDPKAELEQLRKANESLGKRVKALALE